jgi:hypothetical protein
MNRVLTRLNNMDSSAWMAISHSLLFITIISTMIIILTDMTDSFMSVVMFVLSAVTTSSYHFYSRVTYSKGLKMRSKINYLSFFIMYIVTITWLYCAFCVILSIVLSS